MLTDNYEDLLQRQEKSKKGCVAAILVTLAVLIMGGAVWWRHARSTSPKAEAPPPTVGVAKPTAATPSPSSSVAKPTPPPPAPVPPQGSTAAPLVKPAPVQDAASGQVAQMLREAQELVQKDDYQVAREKLYAVLALKPNASTQAAAEEQLGIVNIALVFSPRPMPEKQEYTVQSGDSLDRLARKFSTSIDALRKANNIQGSIIRVNQRLRIFTGAFSVRISKSKNELVVYLNDRFFKRYRCGTGKYSRSPTGQFKITDRIAQPTWYHPDGRVIPYGDTNNLLGTHWLALDVPGYGIHGTWEPETIGKQSSLGCVRLLNPEIEELFMLLPIGTPVEIVE